MKKELKILGLSYSPSSVGSYIAVLSEVKGRRKLPIVIKPSDAQQIALKIEDVKSPRPLTHDLFKSITDAYSLFLKEVFIYSVSEGIFYTKMIITNGDIETEVECTAGDGIALSIVYGSPIYTTNSILELAGVYIDDDGTIENPPEEDIKDIQVVSIEDLEHMMQDAIKNEEYELAAEIRDRIEFLKKQ